MARHSFQSTAIAQAEVETIPVQPAPEGENAMPELNMDNRAALLEARRAGQ